MSLQAKWWFNDSGTKLEFCEFFDVDHFTTDIDDDLENQTRGAEMVVVVLRMVMSFCNDRVGDKTGVYSFSNDIEDGELLAFEHVKGWNGCLVKQYCNGHQHHCAPQNLSFVVLLGLCGCRH